MANGGVEQGFIFGMALAVLVSCMCACLFIISRSIYSKSSPLKRALALRVLDDAGLAVIEPRPQSSREVSELQNAKEVREAIILLVGDGSVIVRKADGCLITSHGVDTGKTD